MLPFRFLIFVTKHTIKGSQGDDEQKKREKRAFRFLKLYFRRRYFFLQKTIELEVGVPYSSQTTEEPFRRAWFSRQSELALFAQSECILLFQTRENRENCVVEKFSTP